MAEPPNAATIEAPLPSAAVLQPSPPPIPKSTPKVNNDNTDLVAEFMNSRSSTPSPPPSIPPRPISTSSISNFAIPPTLETNSLAISTDLSQISAEPQSVTDGQKLETVYSTSIILIPQQGSEETSSNESGKTLETAMREFLAMESRMGQEYFIKKFFQIRVEQEAIRADAEYSVSCAANITHFQRNRYRDILPYDKNRVCLQCCEENEDGYMNASHVSLPKGETKFLASQAPLSTTLDEWWQMVIEHDVDIIVMLCKLVEMNKIKCERYWPCEVGKKEFSGEYEITLESEEKEHPEDEYVLRRLRVEKHSPEGTISKTIHQLQYSEWPDHGCPNGEEQLLKMIDAMIRLHVDKTRPILVHCSAGVGRTGTIIAVNHVRELIKQGDLHGLDLYDLVIQLRRQRASMVQTQDQFQFLHKCVAYYCRQHLGLPNEQHSPMPPPPAPIPHALVRPSSVDSDQLIDLDEVSDDQQDEDQDQDKNATDVPDFPLEPPAPQGPEPLGSAAI